MAFSDLWRRDRKTQEHQGERGGYQGRPNYGGDDLGFDRRGWRTGSDYYGNNDDRYRARQGDDFEGEQHYRGSDEDWRTGSEQSGDYSDTRRILFQRSLAKRVWAWHPFDGSGLHGSFRGPGRIGIE
ncbi:MAG: hypothetical protein ACJ8MH_16735 [Povalibacter sp.]